MEASNCMYLQNCKFQINPEITEILTIHLAYIHSLPLIVEYIVQVNDSQEPMYSGVNNVYIYTKRTHFKQWYNGVYICYTVHALIHRYTQHFN